MSDLNTSYLVKAALLLFIFSIADLRGQALIPDYKYQSGRIINDSTGKPVSYAHVYNESNRFGTITDREGIFRIPAGTSDTIVVTALGYHGQVIFLEAAGGQEMTYRLVPLTYPIEEVRVVNFRNYEQFKKAFVELELPDTPERRARDHLLAISREAARVGDAEKEIRQQQLQPNIRPVKGNITIYSRDELQRMNLEKVKREESRQQQIDAKYNREIIYQVTKLSPVEITDFMGYCNFNEEWLLQAPFYEIIEKIEEKFEAYKLSKEGGILIHPNLAIPTDLA